MGSTKSNKIQLLSKEELKQFKSLFPEIMEEALKPLEIQKLPGEVEKWLDSLWTHNVPHGKQIRAQIIILAYKFFSKDLTEENVRLSHALGWIGEILHAAALIGDDVTDRSALRRGRTCWYLMDGVGLSAVNDMIFLENAGYVLLKKYFRDKPCYADLLETVHDIVYKTAFGQGLDLLTEKHKNIETYTFELYEAVVVNKTAYYAFYLPVAAAMIMAGIKSKPLFEAIKSITLKIGTYFQIQDDFLDVYGKSNIIGKDATDIVNGKCAWPIVMALDRANSHQRQILLENYGHDVPEKKAKVLSVFKELDLELTYIKYELQAREELNRDIQALPEGIPKDFFYLMVASIFGRKF